MPKDNIGDGGGSKAYFDRVIRGIHDFKTQEPSVIQMVMGKALLPINWLVRQMIPESAIKGALNAFDWVGKHTTTARGAITVDHLEECDKFADQVVDFHIAVGMAEGGAAGFFGLPALVVDIPVVVMLALREIRQVGAEYGYTFGTKAEQDFVFSVLAAASANSQKEKLAALATNAYLMNMITKNTWKAIANNAVANPVGAAAAVIGIKSLAKQLGINITKRSALAAIPVIGAVVGAGANSWFIRDVGIAAQKLYQERWLRDHNRWIDGDPIVNSQS
jgi:hypothetical protein